MKFGWRDEQYVSVVSEFERVDQKTKSLHIIYLVRELHDTLGIERTRALPFGLSYDFVPLFSDSR